MRSETDNSEGLNATHASADGPRVHSNRDDFERPRSTSASSDVPRVRSDTDNVEGTHATGPSGAVLGRTPWWRRALRFLGWSFIPLSVISAALVVYEFETSRFQSDYFSKIAAEATYELVRGKSEHIRFPTAGPYDERLGYTRLPLYIEKLEKSGYEVQSQASWSAKMLELDSKGVFALYDEKPQAGLKVDDAGGSALFQTHTPTDVYPTFESIPWVIVTTLLFIENSTLLDAPPTRNPAIEWKRLLRSLIENGLEELGLDRGRPPGASTLATQLEKVRHSADGRTRTPHDKLEQMLSASLRAYRAGPDTRQAREQIVLSYVNSVPLSSIPHSGEIFGLRDGLRIWFDADPVETDRLLRTAEVGAFCDIEDLEARGLAYRQVLMLILAQRRPTALILQIRENLDDLVDAHLRAMREEGVVPLELANSALAAREDSIPQGELVLTRDFDDIKMENSVRTMLGEELGEASLYDLDRLDLTAQSTIEFGVQSAIRERLLALSDPAVVRELGLAKKSLLAEGTAEDLVFSFTLYERTPLGNALRIQVDTDPQPLNINEGVKLDLGSTAKLRTLATYLHIIGELHDELGAKTPEELRSYSVDPSDALTKWVLAELKRDPTIQLPELLDRAMMRTYSANPHEVFYTGGGAHRFGNYDKKHNGRRFTVREAFQRSINLPFVRLMRDVVRYNLTRLDNTGPTIFTDPEHPGRKPRLDTFVASESVAYLRRFWVRYEGLDHAAAVAKLAESKPKWNALRLAVALRSSAPAMSITQFSTLLRERADRTLSDEELKRLYDDHGPGKFDWNDRGYLAKVHPLEMWSLAYRAEHPSATWSEAVTASADVRHEVYRWLFKPTRKRQQDNRIRIVLEREAFRLIHQHWKQLGYPFSSVVPSLATAIGVAADRPDSLARLVGTIANGGIAQPRYIASAFHFAQDTPFETRMTRKDAPGTRVMTPAVAARLKEELRDVVLKGTARRLTAEEPYRSDPLWVAGGKTGTGDHRRKAVDKHGRVLSETPISRSATFVFFLGDRFHGTLTVYVGGTQSAHYSFTSALPVTLLSRLGPELTPIVGATRNPDSDVEVTKAVPKKPRRPAQRARALPQVVDGLPEIDTRELLDYEQFIINDERM